MQNKLSAYERKTRIIEYLILHKQATRYELSAEFNVSAATISRDIVELTNIAPIYTKQGNKGGVYILPKFRSYSSYLTKDEEELLQSLMERVGEDEKQILAKIITKFSMRNVINDEAPYLM